MVLYAVSPADQLHGYNFENFRSCKCVLVLLSEELLNMLQLHVELRDVLHKLLYPPQRVVALLCGVSEEDVPRHVFDDWQSWRKVSTEDEPAVYISSIFKSVTESMQKLITQQLTNITILLEHRDTPIFSKKACVIFLLVKKCNVNIVCL